MVGYSLVEPTHWVTKIGRTYPWVSKPGGLVRSLLVTLRGESFGSALLLSHQRNRIEQYDKYRIHLSFTEIYI